MKTINKAQCQPSYQKHVAPVVEYFWSLFPFNLYCGFCGIFIDITLFPCCWCVQLPFYFLITIPWNTVSMLVIVFAVILGFLVLFALFVSGWVLAAFTSTVVVNTFVFIFGTIGVILAFCMFVLSSIVGSAFAIVLSPGIIFYFAVMICASIIIPG